ncbi:MAG: hypothetical protein E7254_01085 [Lachnospiraceae bacterium]|nr:hypothetical protein [Lachnospiraceae bacterium]
MKKEIISVIFLCLIIIITCVPDVARLAFVYGYNVVVDVADRFGMVEYYDMNETLPNYDSWVKEDQTKREPFKIRVPKKNEDTTRETIVIRSTVEMPKYRLAVPDGYKEGPMQMIKDDYYLWIQEFESEDSKVTFQQDLLEKYEPEEMTPIETVEKEVSGRKIVISSYEDKVIAEYKGDNYYMDIIIEGKDATVEMAEKFAENITDR